IAAAFPKPDAKRRPMLLASPSIAPRPPRKLGTKETNADATSLATLVTPFVLLMSALAQRCEDLFLRRARFARALLISGFALDRAGVRLDLPARLRVGVRHAHQVVQVSQCRRFARPRVL